MSAGSDGGGVWRGGRDGSDGQGGGRKRGGGRLAAPEEGTEEGGEGVEVLAEDYAYALGGEGGAEIVVLVVVAVVGFQAECALAVGR